MINFSDWTCRDPTQDVLQPHKAVKTLEQKFIFQIDTF